MAATWSYSETTDSLQRALLASCWCTEDRFPQTLMDRTGQVPSDTDVVIIEDRFPGRAQRTKH